MTTSDLLFSVVRFTPNSQNQFTFVKLIDGSLNTVGDILAMSNPNDLIIAYEVDKIN